MSMELRWNNTDRGKPEELGQNLSTSTLAIRNPTGNNPAANPGYRGERLCLTA
jgi:hypothetical protein